MNAVCRPLLPALCSLFAAAPLVAFAQAESRYDLSIDCRDPARLTNYEAKQCMGRDLERAERELEAASRALAGRTEPEGASAFERAGQSWRTWRDAECHFRSQAVEGMAEAGTGYGLVWGACALELTRERTRVLQGLRRPGSPAASGPSAEEACRVERVAVAGLALSARNCRYATGHWRVLVEPDLPGLALWRDAERVATVLQLFPKEPGEPVQAILPALRAGGHIPDDGDCVFAPLRSAVAPRGQSLFDIRPAGRRLAAFKATPADQIPDPPCGEYGWSTHGVRYFIADDRQPGRVVYVNEGQDGTLIDPRSIQWVAGTRPTP